MDLSRIARGGTPITLDRPRLLYFDNAATWLLIQKYGDGYLQALYGRASVKADEPKAAPAALVLNSMDALQFYLWAALQADSKLKSEELTLDQVGDFITPYTYPKIFNTILAAIGRDISNPPRRGDDAPGKEDAAAAGPAVAAAQRPADPKRSTSLKKSASRSARSDGRPKGSGRAR